MVGHTFEMLTVAIGHLMLTMSIKCFASFRVQWMVVLVALFYRLHPLTPDEIGNRSTKVLGEEWSDTSSLIELVERLILPNAHGW